MHIRWIDEKTCCKRSIRVECFYAHPFCLYRECLLEPIGGMLSQIETAPRTDRFLQWDGSGEALSHKWADLLDSDATHQETSLDPFSQAHARNDDARDAHTS